jgi:pimeloyl-ACP methyl ester carboxylesterase
MPHDIVTVIEGADGKLILADVRLPMQSDKPPVVIFVHGFKAFKDWGYFPLLSKEFAKNGFACISFNFSHNGTTIQHPKEFDDLELFGRNNYSKELFDLRTVLNKLNDGTLFPHTNMDRSKVFLVGHSRGGAICLITAAENPHILSVATWASIAEMDRTNVDREKWKKDGVVYVPNSRTGQQMPMYFQFAQDVAQNSERFNLQKQCSSIKVPVLVAHGDADKTVPYDDALKLTEWCPNAQLFKVDGADHTFGGGHPYTADKLPVDAQSVFDRTIKLFRSSLSE